MRSMANATSRGSAMASHGGDGVSSVLADTSERCLGLDIVTGGAARLRVPQG